MTKRASEYPSHATNVKPSSGWSTPLNTSWPDPDVARRLNDREPHEWIAVTARVVFDTGTEQLDGHAVRWVPGEHVYVRITDTRLNSGGVWLAPGDCVRR